jgi:hypothetical protein
MSGQFRAPAALPPGKGSPVGGPQRLACLDDVEKRKFLTLSVVELWLLDCPARSQSLYWLSYPVSYFRNVTFQKLKTMDNAPDNSYL